jgi:hypothetical protein
MKAEETTPMDNPLLPALMMKIINGSSGERRRALDQLRSLTASGVTEPVTGGLSGARR